MPLTPLEKELQSALRLAKYWLNGVRVPKKANLKILEALLSAEHQEAKQ